MWEGRFCELLYLRWDLVLYLTEVFFLVLDFVFLARIWLVCFLIDFEVYLFGFVFFFRFRLISFFLDIGGSIVEFYLLLFLIFRFRGFFGRRLFFFFLVFVRRGGWWLVFWWSMIAGVCIVLSRIYGVFRGICYGLVEVEVFLRGRSFFFIFVMIEKNR